MSSSLLDQWYPDGTRKSSSTSDREFQRDVEEFFEDVKCTGYDDDVQEYVEENGRKKSKANKETSSIPLRREGDVTFLSAGSAAAQPSTRNKVLTYPKFI